MPALGSGLQPTHQPGSTVCRLLYIHLVNLESDEWTCRATATKEEAMSLIEGRFQYVTTIEGNKLFKKRK
jgi:hypothetical protein